MKSGRAPSGRLARRATHRLIAASSQSDGREGHLTECVPSKTTVIDKQGCRDEVATTAGGSNDKREAVSGDAVKAHRFGCHRVVRLEMS